MNHTLKILEELVYQLQQEWKDPECLVLAQGAKELETAFRAGHARNRRLLH